MKYKLQLFGKRLQIYAGFPQVWIFIFLVFAAVLFYCLSIKVCDEYYKSLFTNIFSGLLTGLVLSALSGSRQVYIAKQEKKYEWLKQLHERIMDYKTMRGRFLSNDFGEYDRDDFIYDMGAHASWINDFIKIGVSPRGALALSNMSAACAFLHKRDYVIPEDIKQVFVDVCAHRLVMNPQARISNVSSSDVLEDILLRVPEPTIRG